VRFSRRRGNSNTFVFWSLNKIFMRLILLSKCYDFIKENHPEILFAFETETEVELYLDKMIQQVLPRAEALMQKRLPKDRIEEFCLREVACQLGPSRFHFIKRILKDEFTGEFTELSRLGILRYEISTIIYSCTTYFELFGLFEQEEKNRNLRYVITRFLSDHFGPKTMATASPLKNSHLERNGICHQ
jgi:hypothetical protein